MSIGDSREGLVVNVVSNSRHQIVPLRGFARAATRAAVTAFLLASAGLHHTARGQALDTLFPFAAASAADAMRQCQLLLDPAQLVQAARGAIVTVSPTEGPARSIVVATQDVPRFAAELARPPAGARPQAVLREANAGRAVVEAFFLEARDFSILCRYHSINGSMRLVGIDFPLVRGQR